MNARTEFQIIVGQGGKPAFVVVPYEQFRRGKGGFTHGTAPDDVVNFAFECGVSAMAAWRKHFGLTQSEVASRIGITQAAYAQMERVKSPRKATLEKVGRSPRSRGGPTALVGMPDSPPNITLNRTCNSIRRPGPISLWPGRRPLPHAG